MSEGTGECHVDIAHDSEEKERLQKATFINSVIVTLEDILVKEKTNQTETNTEKIRELQVMVNDHKRQLEFVQEKLLK